MWQCAPRAGWRFGARISLTASDCREQAGLSVNFIRIPRWASMARTWAHPSAGRLSAGSRSRWVGTWVVTAHFKPMWESRLLPMSGWETRAFLSCLPLLLLPTLHTPGAKHPRLLFATQAMPPLQLTPRGDMPTHAASFAPRGASWVMDSTKVTQSLLWARLGPGPCSSHP